MEGESSASGGSSSAPKEYKVRLSPIFYCVDMTCAAAAILAMHLLLRTYSRLETKGLVIVDGLLLVNVFWLHLFQVPMTVWRFKDHILIKCMCLDRRVLFSDIREVRITHWTDCRSHRASCCSLGCFWLLPTRPDKVVVLYSHSRYANYRLGLEEPELFVAENEPHIRKAQVREVSSSPAPESCPWKGPECPGSNKRRSFWHKWLGASSKPVVGCPTTAASVLPVPETRLWKGPAAERKRPNTWCLVC